MTERLYYDQAYLTAFESEVLKSKTDAEGNSWLCLKESAFYPTSGGQPFDTGILRPLSGGETLFVSDVEVDEEGFVWHKTKKTLAEGTKVRGEIDFVRRYDHMQQHAGEHILAGCIYYLFGGVTMGLHLGKEDSTIDVTMLDGRQRLTEEEQKQLETLANARVQQNAPIRCWFPSEEELLTLPLRKPASVKEHVRVVEAGDFEMVPCGGTHPKATGELGLIKIKSITPSKGKMRVCFVVGKRAIDYVQSMSDALTKAALLLSCSFADTEKGIRSLKNELQQEKLKSAELSEMLSEYMAEKLVQKAQRNKNGHFVVCERIAHFSMQGLIALGGKICKNKGFLALLQGEGEGMLPLVCMASEDMDVDMPSLLRASGAKGGGKQHFAQGSGSEGCLQKALEILERGA